MRMYDLIEKKKIGQELSTEEIYWIISGYVKGEIEEFQVSALLMAIYFKGMNERERFDLTMAMKYSGDIIDLSEINGKKIDKHSTGGVGDKVTLVLAPIIASLGVPVAKMSGRGLGHTGGTLDKLEAFPGLSVSMDDKTFINQVNSIGLAVCGQTANITPADKKLYALRDVTATVDEISLITSSIMSKKLAAGTDGIVLDVTCGSGAFMKDFESAKELAKSMVDIGKRADKDIAAIITNMDEPLGYAVGNTLEVKEAIESLKGNGPEDFMEVVYTLGSQMIEFSDLNVSVDKARIMMEEAVASGAAFNKFVEFIEAQGGDKEYIYHPERFEEASIIYEYLAKEDGYVGSINATDIGLASMTLGGGREDLDDIIDMSVGLILHKKVGDLVKKGDSLVTVYANDKRKLNDALEILDSAYGFSSTKIEPIKLILDIIK